MPELDPVVVDVAREELGLVTSDALEAIASLADALPTDRAGEVATALSRTTLDARSRSPRSTPFVGRA